jgi:hypothetical protein
MCPLGMFLDSTILTYTGIHQIETSLVSHLMELVETADKDKNGKIDFEEWGIMGTVSIIRERHRNR